MVADSVLLHGWQPGWLEAVILAGVLQLLLLKTLADGRSLLRQHAAMAGLCLLAGIVSLGLPSLGLARAAALFDAAAIVIMGMLLIRLSGLALFRLLLPKLGFVPPRIAARNFFQPAESSFMSD